MLTIFSYLFYIPLVCVCVRVSLCVHVCVRVTIIAKDDVQK